MSIQSADPLAPPVALASGSPVPVRRRRLVSGAGMNGGIAFVLQDREDTPGGLVLDVLAERGLRATTVRLDRGEPLPDPGSSSLAFALGSAGAVDDPARGWADSELEWLRQADRAGTAVLGLGLGAEALAVALGGAVERAPRPQRGWIRVATAVPDLIAPGPWLAWRDDVIRLPARAQLLAHDRVGPQAFRCNGHVGVQFHPAVTPEIVRRWVTATQGTVLDYQGILEATSRDYDAGTAAGRRLLSGFIDSVLRGPR
jgi:GMP synthase-like glutamine amidotransferase